MRRDSQRLWDSYARTLRARNRPSRTVESYLLAATELDARLGCTVAAATRDKIYSCLGKRLTDVSATLRPFLQNMVRTHATPVVKATNTTIAPIRSQGTDSILRSMAIDTLIPTVIPSIRHMNAVSALLAGLSTSQYSQRPPAVATNSNRVRTVSGNAKRQRRDSLMTG